MCAGALLFFLSFNIIIPELPGQLRAIGGRAYVGWIIAAFASSALLARPISGYLTDHAGRKIVMITGAVICFISSFLYPLVGTVFAFFVLRLFHGFSTGFSPTGFAAFTTDVVDPDNKGEALGWQGIFSNLGSSLGYGLGSMLVISFGLSGLYIVSAAMALGATLLFLSLPETKPVQETRKRNIVKDAFYLPAWKPALLMLLICIPLGTLLTAMPDYTLFLGFQNKGLFLTFYIAFSLLVRIVSGKLSDKFGRTFSTSIGIGSQLVSMLILYFIKDPVWFFISAGFYGIGQGFNAPGLFAWAGDVSTEQTRGRALSMLFIALELGIISGGLLSGEFIKTVPADYDSVFLVNIGLSVLSLFFSLRFYRQEKRG